MNNIVYCSGRTSMKAFLVKLSRRGKKPTTLKLRRWDLPDIWKKTGSVFLTIDI